MVKIELIKLLPKNEKGEIKTKEAIGCGLALIAIWYGGKAGYEWVKSKIDIERRSRNAETETKKEKEIIKYHAEERINELREKTREKMKMAKAMAEMKAREKMCGQSATGQDNEVNPTELKRSFKVHCPSFYSNSNFRLKPMIGDIVPEGQDAVLYGMKSAQKSQLIISTLAQVSLEEKPSILSQNEKEAYDTPKNVYCLYINGENSNSTMHDRLDYFGTKLDGNFAVMDNDEFGVSFEDLFNAIRENCIDKPAGTKIVVAVDNLKCFLNGLSADQIKQYRNGWLRLRNELKPKGLTLTSITVAHTEKSGEKISGSYDIECLTPYVIRIDPDGCNHIIMTVVHSRDGKPGNQKRRLFVEQNDYWHHVFEAFVREESPQMDGKMKEKYNDETKRMVVKLHNEGLSLRKIADKMKRNGISISHTEVHQIIKLQSDQGLQAE